MRIIENIAEKLVIKDKNIEIKDENSKIEEGKRLMNDNSDNEFVKPQVLIGADSDPQKITYTWDVVSMDKRSLELQFNFNDPLYISTEDEPEVLQIQILDVNYFISDPEGLPLVTNEDD